MAGFVFGKIFGITLELHQTFILLFGLIAVFLAIFQPNDLIPTMILLFFLFLSVLLHELMHSIVAIRLGAKVKKIILLPIGGLSMTEDIPKSPRAEFLISIAGPLLNFVIVFLILFAVSIFPQLPFPNYLFEKTPTVEEVDLAVNSFPLFGFLWVNLLLGIFNLFIPALPMDGGRVFRSILAKFFGFAKATHIAAKVSRIIAIGFVIIGLLGGNLILAIIGIFVFMGAGQENEMVSIKEIFENQTIEPIINPKPFVIEGEKNLFEVFDIMKQQNKTYFLVKLEHGFGVLSAQDLFMVKKIDWMNVFAKNISRKVHSIPKESLASDVATKFMAKEYSMIPVTENHQLIGVVEAENLQSFLELKKIEKH